jgi:electron transfer flavoprotein beta subunit
MTEWQEMAVPEGLGAARLDRWGGQIHETAAGSLAMLLAGVLADAPGPLLAPSHRTIRSNRPRRPPVGDTDRRRSRQMNIAVLVKQVPDTFSERTLGDDHRLDREAADAVIDEIDSRGVEIALQLVEAAGGEVTVFTMGPDRATEVLRKALAMGADRAVHVVDDALAGADALATSAVLAAAIGRQRYDLVITGNETTDGRTGSVPSMLAERLALPAITQAQQVSVEGGAVRAQRADESGYSEVTAPLPALISVTEKITEPRYPNFKGLMKAKKKPLETLSAADLGVAVTSANVVIDAVPAPARAAGQKVTDDGAGGQKIADYLAAARLI